ncbi:MAG: DUF4198 domain-containing protein [Synergistaceae bacterium]|jgi:uncharacterized GH25 family protein|nr:DUF4198 domain-containing protein [Synergistaceae bacterium]
MFSNFVTKFFSIAVLFSVFSVTAARPAAAHLPVAAPDKFAASTGETVNIRAGLAEPLIEYAYSVENLLDAGHAGGHATMTGKVRFADGSSTPLSFSPADRNAPGKSLFDTASVKIEKPGTAVVAFRFDFNSGTRPTVAFGKTLLNWTADMSATARIGDENVLEVVQDADTGPVSSGQAVTFQFLLRGAPLAGAVVSATYDGAPLPEKPEEGEESNNEYIHATTDASGRVTFIPDRPGTWVIGCEYLDGSAPKNKPEYNDAARYPEWKGIRYRGTLTFIIPIK